MWKILFWRFENDEGVNFTTGQFALLKIDFQTLMIETYESSLHRLNVIKLY